MMHKTPIDLLKIHSYMQLGTFFSDTKKIKNSDTFYNYSDTITDFYWNYAFGIDTQKKEVIQQIKIFSKSIHRSCHIYLTPEQKINKDIKNIQIQGDEIWMALETQNIDIHFPKNIHYKILENHKPSPEFINIFKKASGQIDQSGYSNLPPEYTKSLRNTSTIDDIDIKHIMLMNTSNKGVAIATIYQYKNTTGIYNVATLPEEQKKGYGTLVSQIACKEAFKNKSKLIFLQAETNSVAQKMYKKIGFRDLFIGRFFKIS